MEPPVDGWGTEVTVAVPAPPEAVWAIVSDFSLHPALAGSGEILELRQSGPLAVGMTFESDLRIGEIGSFTPTCLVNEVDPPRRLGWISRPPLDPDETEAHQIEVYWAFEITAAPGGCDLHHTVRIAPPRAGAEELGALLERTDRMTTVRSGMQRTVENVRAAAQAPR